jgi:hypothetical protein
MGFLTKDFLFFFVFFCVFELRTVLVTKRIKRDKNKSIKNEVSSCFGFGASADVRRFHQLFFHAPPLIRQGALKKQIDGPSGGWFVPRRPKKYQGWSDFFLRFLSCF